MHQTQFTEKNPIRRVFPNLVTCLRKPGIYLSNAHMAQCTFLVSTVKYQSPVFVIFMSKNPFNSCHRLQRVNVSYQGEISLHLDLPTQYGRRTRSPLLWALIRILNLDTDRFIELLYVHSPFQLLGHLRTITDCCQHRNPIFA